MKFTAVVGAPVHKFWLPTVFMVGVGFTLIVNEVGVPGQPFAVGVTVIVAVTGFVPLLVPVKEPMLPFPLAARPIEGVLFTQL